MNRAELIAAIAEATGLSKAKAERVLDSILANIARALEQGSDVRIVKFGTFMKKQRAARMGRHPRTGETIHIPASYNPRFNASRNLIAAVNDPRSPGGGPDATETMMWGTRTTGGDEDA